MGITTDYVPEIAILLLGVQLCIRRFPIVTLAVSGDRNK